MQKSDRKIKRTGNRSQDHVLQIAGGMRAHKLYPASVMPALWLRYDHSVIVHGRGQRPWLLARISSADISQFDAIGRCVTKSDLAGEADIGCLRSNLRQTSAR